MNNSQSQWVVACRVGDVELEDVLPFDVGSQTFAIYRSPENSYYATDGLCTHGQVHLAEGMVMGHIIECPKHNGCFDYRTGEATRAPACIDLRAYPVKVEEGVVLIQIDCPKQ